MYNHLSLPRQIHFGAGADSVVFRYTASGQKVAKLVYQTGQAAPQRTDYLGPYQYEGDSLRFFPHAEGRVLRFITYDPAGQARVRYEREYTLKDHLGNLRLAYRAGRRQTFTATLEQDRDMRTRETHQFDSLSVSPPVAVTHNSGYVAKLNADGAGQQPLGPLKQLAVQKGYTVSHLRPQALLYCTACLKRSQKSPTLLREKNRAFLWVGVAGFEPTASSSRTTRATGLRYTPKAGRWGDRFSVSNISGRKKPPNP